LGTGRLERLREQCTQASRNKLKPESLWDHKNERRNKVDWHCSHALAGPAYKQKEELFRLEGSIN